MEIGYIDNYGIIHTLELVDGQTELSKIDIDELINIDLSALFLEDIDSIKIQDDENIDNENTKLKAILDNETKFYPILPANYFALSFDQFSQLDIDQANRIVEKAQAIWTMNNNLTTIENIMAISNHLKSLWSNDPEKFFTEFWHTLKVNLCAKNLRIIYNDVQPAQADGEKDKLIHSYVLGGKEPVIKVGGQVEEQLLKTYSEGSTSQLRVNSSLPEKCEWVASCSIDKSPILLMANVNKVSPLQQTVVQGLINSIQT